MFDRLVAHRRHLHAHPELSFAEHETQSYVLRTLRELHLEAKPIARTGVICRVGPQFGPAIALRADMDALPVQEEGDLKEKSYRSQNAGVMHACGHDGHVATLLCVAETLKNLAPNLRKGVVLLFQPAEEGHFGAKLMVEEGCLETVEMTFGIHLWNTLRLGQVAASNGPVMAHSDRFEIIVEGRGGHGSMPHDTIDPILAAANLVVSAQQIVSRNVDPADKAVVSFGGIQSSSNARNVIPQSVSLCGTIRSYTDEMRSFLEKRLETVCRGVEVMSGATIKYKYFRGYSAVVNDPTAAEIARTAIKNVAGAELCPAPVVLSGEDFYCYAEKVKSCFIFVGSAIGDGILRPHHNPNFDIDEKSLQISLDVFMSIIKQTAM